MRQRKIKNIEERLNDFSALTINAVSYTHLDVYKRQAMMFAFSSASSVGTLPRNLECSEKLGAKREVCLLYTSRCV